MGTRSNNLLQQMLQNVDFKDQGLCCIVNKDGTVIVSTTDETPFIELKDIFAETVNTEDDDEGRRVLEDINAHRSGMAQFNSLGEDPVLLGYNFLGINDWMLLTLISADLFSEDTTPYLIRYITIIGILTLVMLTILASVVWYYRRTLGHIRAIALTDPLTGGHNDLAFRIDGEKLCREHPERTYAIIYLNIRKFKQFNEHFGVQHGDELLRQISQSLRDLLQEGELLCRNAGDHFYLLLACADEDSVRRRLTDMLAYLENMPVAFCSIKVLLDGNDRPRDFQFTYCNRAHEELEGVQPGELLGKNFYEFFQDTDPKWLRYYYETAYQGIPHVIRSYSPEIQKHLLIYTFQLEPGHCECVLLDETEQQFLFQELEHSRETMKRVLELTTDQVFQYLPERGEVILDGRGNGARQVLSGESLHQVLIQKELLHPDYWTELESAFLRIKGGEHAASIVVQGGRLREGDWKWFRVTMFGFQDGYTHERKVLGFLQNIDEFRSREEALRKKAEQDSLTGVLNAGEGKQRISNILERQLVDAHACHAMFVMDLDDFKGVNDTLGHMAGDQMLTAFARILRQTFRAEDVIYRLGGDEFVVFVEKLHDAEQSVQAILHRLIGHVEEAREEHPLLACSVGVLLTNQKRSFEACYQMADQALYKAKRSGKGRFHITTDVSDQQTLPDAKQ